MKRESQLRNAIHGRKLKIQFSDDEDFYWVGIVEVTDWQYDRRFGRVVIICDCDPYKYKNAETVKIFKAADGIKTKLFVDNLNRPVAPKVTVPFYSELGFTINGESFNHAIDKGADQIVRDLILQPGRNVITITVEGLIQTIPPTYHDVIFKYQEASL